MTAELTLREVDGAVEIHVLVQPRASRAKLGPIHDGRLKVAVTAPPVDGEANAAVIELFAKQLKIARGAVTVVAGETSRRKTVRIAVARAAITALLGLGLVVGCQGTAGTIDVSLATAPGSTLLDGVASLRLVLTDPHQVETTQRSSAGQFLIDLQLAATGASGALIVDGLDANGNVIATGATPPFPLGGVNASVVVFMAAPNSITTSIAALAPARAQLATGALNYGAVFAGGLLADGTATDATAIYNAYDHTLATGIALPAPRSALALGVGSSGTNVYLFGGTDSGGTATASVSRFNTAIAPSGSMTDLGTFAGFARAGQTALSIGNENLLVTGTPIAELAGFAPSVTARTELAGLPPSGASLTGTDGVAAAIFAGASGVARYRNDQFDLLAVPAAAREGAVVVALPSGKAGVVCGGPDLIRIDVASGAAETLPAIPSEPRTGCAVAATARYLVIAGGTTTAAMVPTAEIYDASSLALIATQPLAVPRTGATATALPNGQILIAGGTDAAGAPIATLELFTPDSTE